MYTHFHDQYMAFHWRSMTWNIVAQDRCAVYECARSKRVKTVVKRDGKTEIDLRMRRSLSNDGFVRQFYKVINLREMEEKYGPRITLSNAI
jgi:hypothetical protein